MNTLNNENKNNNFNEVDAVNIQKVLMNRINKVWIKDDNKISADLTVLAAALTNLQNLGYVFDAEDRGIILSATENTLVEIVEAAKALKGDTEYKVMYPNFPKQVAEASDVELFVNAMLHYTGDFFGIRIMPEYEKEVRKKLNENVETTVLSVAFQDDVDTLFKEIATQGQPYSEQDKNDLKELFKIAEEVYDLPEITVKENLAFMMVAFDDDGKWYLNLQDNFKTVTDVLRLAVAYSHGDVSLAENTKFRLSRKQRREVLSLLDKVLTDNSDNVEDFGRYAEQWKRLAYHLHYHEYASQRAENALAIVQSQKIRSFDSLVETAVKNSDVIQLVSLLSSRPGVYARRVAELLRKFPDDRGMIVEGFSNVSSKVSVRVLVQMWNHFNGPTADVVEKINVSYKSRNQMTGFKKNTLDGDYSDVIEAIENGLQNRFNKKVYVDNADGNDYVIPLGVRSASSGLRVVGRGSRVKLAEDKGTVRMFMHWRDIENGDDPWHKSVDLDLSAFFLNEDFSKKDTVAYYNLRNREAYHSGDITSAPEGAAEFIDVDIEKALANGWRYVLMTVYSYSRQKFSDIPEAWAGVMLRDEVQSGEIFEPATVSQRFDLTGETVNSSPIIFDLKTREMIWWDSTVRADDRYNYNVASNESELTVALKSLVHAKFMTVDKLVELSAVKVDNVDEADMVINPASTSQVLQLLA